MTNKKVIAAAKKKMSDIEKAWEEHIQNDVEKRIKRYKKGFFFGLIKRKIPDEATIRTEMLTAPYSIYKITYRGQYENLKKLLEAATLNDDIHMRLNEKDINYLAIDRKGSNEKNS